MALWRWSSALAVVLWSSPAVVSADDIVLDWYRGTIEVTAVARGRSGETGGDSSMEHRVRSAARKAAYLQLIDQLSGLARQANEQYRDDVIHFDPQPYREGAVMENVKIVDERFSWLEGLPKAVVTLRLPMAVVVPPVTNAARDTGFLQGNVPKSSDHGSSVPAVVIDATHLDFEPGLRPRLLGPDGRPFALISWAGGPAQSGVFRYVSSVDEGRQWLGAGTIVLRAQQAGAAGDLVLSAQDKQRLIRLEAEHGLISRQQWVIAF